MTTQIETLIAIGTSDEYFALALELARVLGVDTSSWRAGDPTRSCYRFISDQLSAKDPMTADFIRAGFLELAEGEWLREVALELYGVEPQDATFATGTITLTNTLGGFYPIAINDLTFKNSATSKTYRNSSQGRDPVTGAPVLALGSGVTAVFDFTADEAGADSSAAANEVDTLVTTKTGVVVVSSTAAIGVDAQSDPEIRDACRDTRGALSPNGPPDAYEYVAKNKSLTGVADISRARAIDDTGDFTVPVYVASTSGPVAGASVIAAQAVIERWATPIGFRPTVINATSLPVNVAAVIEGVGIPADFLARITGALAIVFRALPIADSAGYTLDPTTITTAVRNAVPQITGFASYAPLAPLAVVLGHVPVLGTVTVTEAP